MRTAPSMRPSSATTRRSRRWSRGIVADFVRDFDASGDCCWIAETRRSARRFDLPGSQVEDGGEAAAVSSSIPRRAAPELGTRLIDECIHFARDAGYRTITLWTRVGVAGGAAPVSAGWLRTRIATERASQLRPRSGRRELGTRSCDHRLQARDAAASGSCRSPIADELPRVALPLLAAAATGIHGRRYDGRDALRHRPGSASLAGHAPLRARIPYAASAAVLVAKRGYRIAPRDLLPIALLGIGQFGILVALLNYGLAVPLRQRAPR